MDVKEKNKASHKKSSAEDRLMAKVAAYTIDQYGPYKFLEETWAKSGGDPAKLEEIKKWLDIAPRIMFNIGQAGTGQEPEVELTCTQISKAISDLYETIIPNIVGRAKKVI